MAQSIERKIKRGHIQIETKTVITEMGFYNDPILGVQWYTNIEQVNVIKK